MYTMSCSWCLFVTTKFMQLGHKSIGDAWVHAIPAGTRSGECSQPARARNMPLCCGIAMRLPPPKKALAIPGKQIQKRHLARPSPHWQGHSMLMAFTFMIYGSYAAKVWVCIIALWWYIITMWPVAALHQCHHYLFRFLEGGGGGGFPPTVTPFLRWPLVFFFFGGATGSSFWVWPAFNKDACLSSMACCYVIQPIITPTFVTCKSSCTIISTILLRVEILRFFCVALWSLWI